MAAPIKILQMGILTLNNNVLKYNAGSLKVPPTVQLNTRLNKVIQGGVLSSVVGYDFSSEETAISFDMPYIGENVKITDPLINDLESNGTYAGQLVFDEAKSLIVYTINNATLSQTTEWGTTVDGSATFKISCDFKLVVANVPS